MTGLASKVQGKQMNIFTLVIVEENIHCCMLACVMSMLLVSADNTGGSLQ